MDFAEDLQNNSKKISEIYSEISNPQTANIVMRQAQELWEHIILAIAKKAKCIAVIR